MPDSNFNIPPDQERLQEILLKIMVYQRSLSDDREVELEELRSKGVLSPEDAEFFASHSVTYKPHRRWDYHALDTLHMPTEDGGCVFIGPTGPPLIKRRALLSDFQTIVEDFLQLPRPSEELLLHVDFSEHDGMGVAPEMVCFTFGSAEWRQRLPALRSVAAEFGFHPVQDEEIQGNWGLTFRIARDAARTGAAVVALLERGCGYAEQGDYLFGRSTG